MSEKFQIIHTVADKVYKAHPEWNMPYVPAIKVIRGYPLYISGVNAAPVYHSHPHKFDEFDNLDFQPEAQARQTMKNLEAILCQAGGAFKDVVQIFVFIVNIKKNAEPVNKVISNYFDGYLPSSTVVGVSELITDPRLIVEVTATAYLADW